MKRLKSKWTSCLLIAAMLFSLLPPITAFAAATITITNMYTNPAGAGTSAPANQNNVTRTTKTPFKIVATITNISSAQINTLSYEITNVSTGDTSEEKNNKAQQTANGEITFNNVALTEGLNKIVVKLGDTLISAPGWVYFTPSTNLSDFSISGVPFDENKLYPETVAGGTTGITIKGYSPNAKEVKAYLPGNSVAKNGFINNQNYFFFPADINTKTGCDSTSDICLQPGDNRIKFVASNDTNSYETEKKLIYNNGLPFAFNVAMKDTVPGNASMPQANDRYLVDVPDFAQPDGGSANFTLKADIKQDLKTASGSTVSSYATTEVRLNGTTLAVIDNNIPTETTSIGSTTGGNGTSYSVTTATYNAAAKQKFFTVNITGITSIPNLSTTPNPQVMEFIFQGNGMQSVKSAYKFNFVNDSQPNVVKLSRVVGQDTSVSPAKDIEVQLADSPTQTEITELPADLKIYTNNKADSVDITLGTAATTNVTAYTVENGYRVFKYKLNNILDGRYQMTVIPKNAGGSGPQKTYDFVISNAPYVILTNLYNNKNISKVADDLTCGTYTAGCFTGRVVNFDPTVANNYVEVQINDRIGVIPSGAFDASGNFAFDLNVIKSNYTGLADIESLFTEGKNVVKFSIYVAKNKVTEASYNIFKFTTEAPAFTDVVLNTDGGKRVYTKSQNDTMYVTSERVVSFTVSYYNDPAKGGNSSLNLKVAGKYGNTDVVENHTINTDTTVTAPTVNVTVPVEKRFFINNTPDPLGTNTFVAKTYDIKLPDKDNVVFEFSVTNQNSQITAFKTITITRQPVPYKIVAPLLIKNEKNEDQANVNSNFYMVVIEAENADSVTFGKEQAFKKTETISGILVDRYYYEVKGLKPGKNQVKFTVNRGSQKSDGSFYLFNTDTPIDGAQFLTKMNTKLTAFDGEVQLSFPKDTMLKRSKPNNKNNEFITSDRSVYFGIADSATGRVDKFNPAPVDDYASSRIAIKTTENTFHPASKLFYMDAGFVKDQDTPETTIPYLEDGLTGRGIEPFDENATSEFFDRMYPWTFAPTQRGTLTLKFNPSIRNDAWKYVTVMALTIDENLSGQTDISWRNIGGVVDNNKNTITVPFDKFGYYQVMYMDRGFNDMTDHEYARNELETMYSKGLMNSKTTVTFSPSESITRGEFAALLVRIFDIPLNFAGDPTFGDVPKVDTGNRLYNYKLVETAARAGIVRGMTNNIFSPESTITRQDAAVMIARAADLKMNSDLKKSQESLAKTFTDGLDVNYYAAPAVEAITKAGFIEGRKNVLLPGQKKETVRFDPTMDMTRADASIIAMRVLKSQKKVPK